MGDEGLFAESKKGRAEVRDPGGQVRRRISFESTNLIGSSRRIIRDAKNTSQDDGKVKGPTFRFAKNGAPGEKQNGKRKKQVPRSSG